MKIRIYIQSVEIDKLRCENNTLYNAVERSEKKLDKILSLLEGKYGSYELRNDQESEEIPEIIPDFLTLSSQMKSKSFFNVAHTFITNQCQISFNKFKEDNTTTMDKKSKENHRTRFNKLKRAMNTFIKFMGDIPPRPTNTLHLNDWKGSMSVCIKDGIKEFQTFMLDNGLKKGTRKNEISISILIDPKTIDLLKSHFEKVTDNAQENNAVVENIVRNESDFDCVATDVV